MSRVVSSNHADYQPGDWVLGYSGWQDYELSDGSGLVKLGDNPQHPSWSLGVLGMPGFTASWVCWTSASQRRAKRWWSPRRPGPVGATVGQIGKGKGCRTVGIAGGAEKCRYAVETIRL